MTREQIKEHFALRREMALSQETLKSLCDAASPGAQVLTGMPHAPGVTDKTGDLAAEIADMESEIEGMEKALAAEEPEIEAFIREIRNSRTRMIFRLRLLRGMTWKEVASVLGKWNTAKSCQDAFWSYVDFHC